MNEYLPHAVLALYPQVKKAQDNLLCAKISQSISANVHQYNDFPFKKGNRVILSTLHRCRDYKAEDEHWVMKFIPCYYGPYLITKMAPGISTITVNMPNHMNTFPMFYTSQALPFIENDKELFLNWKSQQPPAIMVDSHEEYTVNRFWRNKSVDEVCNTLYVGLVMALKKTIGYWDMNLRTVKHSTFGWLRRTRFCLR